MNKSLFRIIALPSNAQAADELMRPAKSFAKIYEPITRQFRKCSFPMLSSISWASSNVRFEVSKEDEKMCHE
jgi:hypothetical protein